MSNLPGRYFFGLTDAQEERACRLHRESIIFDFVSQHAGGNIFAHYPAALQSEFWATMASQGRGMDALTVAMYWPYEMAKQGKSDLIREWLVGSGLTCGTYGIDVHDGRDPHQHHWESTVFRYKNLPWLRYVTKASEIRQAKREGKVAAYAQCQPVSPAPRDLGAFEIAYQKGLRSFMLTYNQMDNIGVGCTERVDAGLSNFGIKVVKYCNDIGMIVDVSHCGHLTTVDACRHSKKPVTANHTAARRLFDHARGKKDDALKAIADTGGVIGVVAAPPFLTRDQHPTIELMLDHIDYIANLIGWRHVALGTDWPLQAPDDVLLATLGEAAKDMGFREEDQLDLTKRLIGFDDIRDLPNITRGLVKRGYDDEQVKGILGENALRVFEEICG
jgi:membrane dipeptidase